MTLPPPKRSLLKFEVLQSAPQGLTFTFRDFTLIIGELLFLLAEFATLFTFAIGQTCGMFCLDDRGSRTSCPHPREELTQFGSKVPEHIKF